MPGYAVIEASSSSSSSNSDLGVRLAHPTTHPIESFLGASALPHLSAPSTSVALNSGFSGAAEGSLRFNDRIGLDCGDGYGSAPAGGGDGGDGVYVQPEMEELVTRITAEHGERGEVGCRNVRKVRKVVIQFIWYEHEQGHGHGHQHHSSDTTLHLVNASCSLAVL